jgi:hypothetical protein
VKSLLSNGVGVTSSLLDAFKKELWHSFKALDFQSKTSND